MKANNLHKILLVFILFIITATLMYFTVERKNKFNFRVKSIDLPTDIGGWKSQKSFGDYFGYFSKKYGSLEIMRDYSNGNKSLVLYFGYHENMADQLDYHTPEICYPDGGWDVVSKREVVAHIGGMRIPLLQIVVEKNGRRELVTYWYQSRRQVISKMFKHQLLFVLNGIVSGRTDGGFVRISGPLNHSMEEESNVQVEFGEQVLRVLMDRFREFS